MADVSDFFFFSSVLGAGKGRKSSRQKGGGYFMGNRERGGGVPRRGGGVVHTGAGRVLRGRGGGVNIFFRGRNVHQAFHS